MLGYATIGTNDMSRAMPFYDAVMEALGHGRFFTAATHVGYGDENSYQTWVVNPYDGAAATVGNGTHIAFLAPNRAAVDAAHAAALAHGGTDEGPPGLRTHYHPDYYGAYFRDPDGNKLQVVCHTPE